LNWRENFSAALPLGQDSAHINTKGEQLAASNKKNWENFKQHELTFCLGFWPSTNPRFYKYSWQIWTPECGLEGQDFFVRGNRMSTASFVELVEKMEAEKQPGWIYVSVRGSHLDYGSQEG
jgi:hypothetical protein